MKSHKIKKILLTLLMLPLFAIGQCWESVSAGNSYTVAQKTDGTLWSWGRNHTSQLGLGTSTDVSVPTQINADNDWLQFSNGSIHTLALKTDGSLWAWGNNGAGQLGNGTTENSSIPIQIGIETDWVHISCGFSHSLAIKSDGTLWAWGRNDKGQLGDGTILDKSVPTQIGTDSDWQTVYGSPLGGKGSIALKTNGTLWAWGHNNEGQLGDGTTTDRLIPTQIGTDTNWEKITSIIDYSLAIKTNGTLWAWGRNFYGQLGIGSNPNNPYIPQDNQHVPVQVGTDTDWAEISAGGFHALALKTSGSLWGWGDNNYYFQLGISALTDQYSPVQVGNDTDWVSISAGGVHTTAIKSDNSLWVCGWNKLGELGIGLGNENMPGNDSQWGLVPVTCDVLSNPYFDENIAFNFYPNPTYNILHIENLNQQIIADITVLDITGKVVITVNANESQIDVSALKAGLYFVKITSNNKVYDGKFIKQ
jgi:hypothetical protein